ncbi:MAG: hypothetical protein WAV09_01815 [Minisyncoccia bacterium]
MTRTETIHELNEERKRKEMLVWQKFLATTATKTTAERVKERTVEMERIRDEYAKALLQVDRSATTEKYPNTIPEKSSQKETATQTKKTLQKETPNDDILKGAENLPENQPLNPQQENRNKNVDGIQGPQNEPAFVRNAREQNRSEEIRETQQEEQAQGDRGYFNDEQENTQTKQVQTALDDIEKVLSSHDLSSEDFFRNVPGADIVSKLESIISESRGVSYVFPVFILAAAAVVDIVEFINAMPLTGVFTMILLSLIKYSVLPLIFIGTFGSAGFFERVLIRKLLMTSIARRGYFYILSPLFEFIPLIGAFWPGTILLVLWLVNAKTTAGRLLLEVAKVAEEGGVK